MTKNNKIVKKEDACIRKERKWMPKVYSNLEKENIRKKLYDAANESIFQKGIRKTTVDELVRKAGIPKGTFYLYYSSKEKLLFEVILEYHRKIEKEMMERCEKEGQDISIDKLADIIVDGILGTMNSCLRAILIPEEVEALMKKLPPDIVENHLKQDNEFMTQMLVKLQPNLSSENIEALGAAFHEIYFASFHRESIGEKNFREGIYLLTRGLLLQICENEGYSTLGKRR